MNWITAVAINLAMNLEPALALEKIRLQDSTLLLDQRPCAGNVDDIGKQQPTVELGKLESAPCQADKTGPECAKEPDVLSSRRSTTTAADTTQRNALRDKVELHADRCLPEIPQRDARWHGDAPGKRPVVWRPKRRPRGRREGGVRRCQGRRLIVHDYCPCPRKLPEAS